MGRDALQRFYVIHADPRANHPALGRPNRNPAMPTTRAGLSIRADEARRGLLSRVQDPAVPPGERFQGLQSVTTISCTNVRELLLGPGADVTDALRQGRHVIARYPSERALADLQTRMPASVPNERLGGPIQGLATSAATVVGVVTNNPRLVTCTRLLSGVWWGPQGI
jgi:hypothetical protein